MFQMYAAERRPRSYPVTFRDKDNNVISDPNVVYTVVRRGTGPTAETTWLPISYTHYPQPDEDGFHGEVALHFLGPLAMNTVVDNGVRIPFADGGRLYITTEESLETDMTFVEDVIIRSR